MFSVASHVLLCFRFSPRGFMSAWFCFAFRSALSMLTIFRFSLLAHLGRTGFSDGPLETAPESMQNQSRISRHMARQKMVAVATRYKPKASAPAIGQMKPVGFDFANDNVKLRRAATCISIMNNIALTLPAKWITTIDISVSENV